MTPKQALAELQAGNERFVAGRTAHPGADIARLRQAATAGQQPFATVLCCSDSRCPPEIIFDRGIGDLFVVRVAGNVCGVTEIASVEFGVAVLRTPLCVVLGHTGCGAVRAVLSGERLSGNLARLCRQIKQAAGKARAAHPRAADDESESLVVRENVWLSTEELLRGSGEIRRLVADGSVGLLGAVLDLPSGRAGWLGQHPHQRALI